MLYARRIGLIAVLAPAAVLLLAFPIAAEEWSRFRGPNGSGVSESTGLPVELGPQKNKAWEVDVPFGRSSPAVSACPMTRRG